MSSEENRRDQARQLLRAMGEIDDRFLTEAMEQAASSGAKMASGPNKKAGGKLRRYSVWALTAAACLTVAVIGRHAFLTRVTDTEQLSVAEEGQEEAAEEARQDGVPDTAREVVSGRQFHAAAEASATAQEAAGDAAEEEEASAPAAAKDAAGEEEASAPAAAKDAAEEAEVSPQEAAGEAEASAPAAAEEAADYEAAMNAAAPAQPGSAMKMANPFLDVQTLEEAQKKAGFSLTVPEALTPYDNLLYRVIPDQMLEVIFQDAGMQEGYRIRKGKNMGEEISGDYNAYPREAVIRMGETEITLRGEDEDHWNTAVWTQSREEGGGQTVYAFSICADQRTFTKEEILKMAKEMQLV